MAHLKTFKHDGIPYRYNHVSIKYASVYRSHIIVLSLHIFFFFFFFFFFAKVLSLLEMSITDSLQINLILLVAL